MTITKTGRVYGKADIWDCKLHYEGRKPDEESLRLMKLKPNEEYMISSDKVLDATVVLGREIPSRLETMKSNKIKIWGPVVPIPLHHMSLLL